MQYRRSQKEIISYLTVLRSVGGFRCYVLSAKWQTVMHFTLLYTIHYGDEGDGDGSSCGIIVHNVLARKILGK
jgi:hypothetical protein